VSFMFFIAAHRNKNFTSIYLSKINEQLAIKPTKNKHLFIINKLQGYPTPVKPSLNRVKLGFFVTSFAIFPSES
ncbi:hypothetical protein, partial [Enterobacter kobei]|uniref:hypothetical protein n=1 Tax=Enterobacter kobei TaxID=208224 RepID=UPI002A8232D4